MNAPRVYKLFLSAIKAKNIPLLKDIIANTINKDPKLPIHILFTNYPDTITWRLYQENNQVTFTYNWETQHLSVTNPESIQEEYLKIHQQILEIETTQFLNIPSLQSIGGNIQFKNSPHLTTINLPSLGI